jgi:hypothetical protein
MALVDVFGDGETYDTEVLRVEFEAARAVYDAAKAIFESTRPWTHATIDACQAARNALELASWKLGTAMQILDLKKVAGLSGGTVNIRSILEPPPEPVPIPVQLPIGFVAD